MSHMHPSRVWKGCRVCKPHKCRGVGRRDKDPVSVQRKLGLSKRYGRHSLGHLD